MGRPQAFSGHTEIYEAAQSPRPEQRPQENLAYLMAAHDVSQSALARELGVDQSNLSKVLAGKRELGTRLAARLGRRFQVPAEVFLPEAGDTVTAAEVGLQ